MLQPALSDRVEGDNWNAAAARLFADQAFEDRIQPRLDDVGLILN